MKYQINRAVVIGAGTMGAAIAAHLANAGIRVTLLDIIPFELTEDEEVKGLSFEDKSVRNRIVKEGLDRAGKSRPASFFTKEHAGLVSIGNLEDDFDVVKDADWIIEVIIENLQIKRDLMARIDSVKAPHTIVSTNTSGIPIASIAEGLSENFRGHLLGTHFFNPPRYLKLLELIPTPDTLPEVLKSISHFCEFRLGKGIVLCKDTPNFIANRLFAGSAAFEMNYILEHGYSVEEVDAITGPPIGNPKTATFRLFDLIGLDVWEHVGQNLAPAIQHDEHALRYMQSENVISLIHTMVVNGWLGVKVKQGFYKEVRNEEGKKEFWPLNLETMEHAPPKKPRFDSIGKVKDIDELGERLEILLEADDKAGELVRALTFQSFAYASERIPEIADTPMPIDEAMRWGFGREAGPFETWDLIGVEKSIGEMREFGFNPPPWVEEMLAKGFNTFYKYDGDSKVGVYNPSRGEYDSIEANEAIIYFQEKRDANKVISQNPGATLLDLGDGVLGVELHTKMNALDDDIFNMILIGMDKVEKEYEGLVISTDDVNFSVGANLMMVVMGAQGDMWDQLEGAVKKLQDMNMRMRYFSKPVIVAPAGLTLGGGAEILMHASRIVAGAELYTGLVEIGAGVIPAGGGTKEMLRRIVNPPMKSPDVIVLPFLQRVFEQIGLAKVAVSAEEARAMDILLPQDRVIMNRDHLLAEAKKEVLHMAFSGYHAPLPEKIYAAGRDALGAVVVQVYMMKEAGFATEYEYHIASKLGYVMTGGELSQPTWVDEQYILDLEREAFLSLVGEEKTQERMWNLLRTGRPLRN
jgi:3-hydroxyacyl-CoA dehydrogenase